MTRKLSTLLICGALLLAFAAEPISAQCAMCRRALESPEGQQLVGALRRGILVLIAAPFLLFAVVATLAVRSQRRSNGDSELEGRGWGE
jgi:hypothetical protein